MMVKKWWLALSAALLIVTASSAWAQEDCEDQAPVQTTGKSCCDKDSCAKCSKGTKTPAAACCSDQDCPCCTKAHVTSGSKAKTCCDTCAATGCTACGTAGSSVSCGTTYTAVGMTGTCCANGSTTKAKKAKKTVQPIVVVVPAPPAPYYFDQPMMPPAPTLPYIERVQTVQSYPVSQVCPAPEPVPAPAYCPAMPVSTPTMAVPPPAPVVTMPVPPPAPAMSVTTFAIANPAMSGHCCLRVVSEDGESHLEIQNGSDARMTCDHLTFKVPGCSAVKVSACEKQVQISTSYLKATADSVTRSGPKDRIVLEGHVTVHWSKDGGHVDLVVDKATVDLVKGHMDIETTSVKPAARTEVRPAVYLEQLQGFYP
jgi:hypothetical protein